MTESEDFEIVESRLWHPETPIALNDGGLMFAETDTGRICVKYPDGLLATFAAPGGRPYGCLFGSDQRLYITQSGLHDTDRIAPRPVAPSLQRASRDGSHVEIVATEADGVSFTAPNSLVWGAHNTLYITDSGHWDPDARSDMGRIYSVDYNGDARIVQETGRSFPNGIAVETDGSLVWVESYTRLVRRLRPGGSAETITVLPEGHTPEAIKIDSLGNFWVANFEAGGIDVIRADGTPLETIATGGVPINFLWHDGWLYVVDFGREETDVNGIRPGQITRTRSNAASASLFTGSIRETTV